MDKIYPEKQPVSAPFALSPEEELTLKKALVLAIEKGIEHPQDRALDAVTALDEGRREAVKAGLHRVMDLEPQVRAEGAALAAKVAAAYEKGTVDVVGLVPVIDSLLVDSVIYAKRFIDVKEDRELTPIFEEKVVVPVEPEPIIEDGGDLDPIIIEEKP